MPRELEKVTIRLRKGDFDRIAELFGPRGLSANEAIRLMVATYVDKADSAAETSSATISVQGVDV